MGNETGGSLLKAALDELLKKLTIAFEKGEIGKQYQNKKDAQEKPMNASPTTGDTSAATADTPPDEEKPVSSENLKEVPSIRNGMFQEWFDNLSQAQFEEVWEDEKLRNAIKSRFRSPGGMHEWYMVSRANVFKKWGVTAEQILNRRTEIAALIFKDPSGAHGKQGSTMAHNEILEIIDDIEKSSITLTGKHYAFREMLREWAKHRLAGELPDGIK